MKIRTAVIDDEKPARDRVLRLLGDQDGFEIVGQAEDVSSGIALLEEEKPDLCFLDVQMPGGEGFDVLRKSSHVPRVVFVTAYDQYAVRAFEVNSLDYLLKPYTKKRFAETLQRVRDAWSREGTPGAAVEALLEQLRTGFPQVKTVAEGTATEESGGPERITARRGTRILLLEPDEIVCFEADDTLVYARTAEGRFMVETTLADLEERMGHRFFRTHRSYLVNVARIGEILPDDAGTYRIVLKDPDKSEVPLSRRQARKLRERIPW